MCPNSNFNNFLVQKNPLKQRSPAHSKIIVENYFNLSGFFVAGTNFHRDTLQKFLVLESMVLKIKMQVALKYLKYICTILPFKWKKFTSFSKKFRGFAIFLLNAHF